MWEIYLLTILCSVVLTAIGEIAAMLRCNRYSVAADFSHWVQAILILCIPGLNILMGFIVLVLGITLPKKTLQDLMDTYG